MTDFEMTKLIAEYLGLGYIRPNEECDRAVEYNADPQNEAWMIYAPLDDDGEALRLVKRFDMVIEREKDDSFGVTLFSGWYKNGRPTFVVRQQRDLNRAIVECVAKYVASQRESTPTSTGAK